MIIKDSNLGRAWILSIAGVCGKELDIGLIGEKKRFRGV